MQCSDNLTPATQSTTKMSNSVVKVTDSMLNDSLLLLVGEDGTVTPDKATVQSYLSQKSGATNIQLMHINKTDGEGVDVSLDNVTYIPEADSEYVFEDHLIPSGANMSEIAHHLCSVKLDHDYTPHISPSEDVDELAQTLSILEGGQPELVSKSPQLKPPPRTIKVSDKLKQANRIVAGSNLKKKLPRASPRAKPVVHEKEEDDDDDEESDDDYMEEMEEGDSDSDFGMDESKARPTRRSVKASSKLLLHKIKTKLPVTKIKEPDLVKPAATSEIKTVVEPKTPDASLGDKTSPPGGGDKKTAKKEKKTPKPIPDDFALFSSPDIIRRVGGKDPTTPDGPPLVELSKPPAKIEVRSRSTAADPQNLTNKQNRLSLDGKVTPKSIKIRKLSGCEASPTKRQNSTDSTVTSLRRSTESSPKIDDAGTVPAEQLDMPSAEEIQAIIGVESTNGNLTLVEGSDLAATATDQSSMALDGSGLDLDPSLLDNLNNDLISDDILFQVAQSLVSNTDLQNAIDKSINEGSLMIDPAMMTQDVAQSVTSQVQGGSSSAQKGTQIVRSDGRIVVIPPIERPTTRSRNKKRADPERAPTPKFTHKPLDEEHVSGNELDSSDNNGEEESEDDPNKLWCICNQPHNNRFMICCDTCEEWYHGKCVNITKAMGQQMESEGKDWICIYCRDSNMKRPTAAARRVRKASRNSRQSTDSAGSSQVHEVSGGAVPCVVCHKPARNNSIFCTEACILAHAQGVEKVVVYERSTGRVFSGNKAPSASNLDQWLKDHPGFEVVRAGKTATPPKPNLTQSRLKLVKNSDNHGVSLAVLRKGVNVGVLKHSPKHPASGLKSPSGKTPPPGFKVHTKQVGVATTPQKTFKVLPKSTASSTTPPNSKTRPAVTSPQSKSIPSSSSQKDGKLVAIKTPKARLAEQSSVVQPRQENIRENVQRTMCDQLMNRVKMVDDLKMTEDEVKTICGDVESQLYKCFGDTGQKYKNKYRSLMFNIKDIKNQSLWRRIVEKTISPYQLVRLSPDDLASQELALWREREAKHQLDMIKKSELELLNCNRQYVLKTHKGEQVLDVNRANDHIDTTEVITSLTAEGGGDGSDKEGSKARDTSKERDKKTSKSSHKDRERKSSNSKDRPRHRSTSKEHDRSRRRSRSRDRKHTDSGKRSRSRERGRHRKSSHKSSKHKKDVHRTSSTEKLDKKSKEILEQLVDNKIVPPLEDHVWKDQDPPVAESDSDHEPTSTVTIPTPPRQSDTEEYQPAPLTSSSNSQSHSSTTSSSSKDKPVQVVAGGGGDEGELQEKSASSPNTKLKLSQIWKGVINMIDVAQISISAHEVSGDCKGLGTELPSHLDIIGRIAPETVWDYISKMRCSNSKIISLVRLKAINVEEKVPYLALYSYLSNRDRLGVVKSANKAVKDFYIFPLASQKPIPQALLPLTGFALEGNRPALLLGIIVRDKRKRPLGESSATTTPAVKKVKVEITTNTPPQRSYTPPPMKDPRLKLPLPPPVTDDQDDDEPYSPEDSDPDGSITAAEITPALSATFLESGVTSSFQPFSNKFDDIPGLGNPVLPSSTQEIQREMEKLNKEIEAQKSEINNISQNIATASTEIGTSALANIALPSNLQQILDSIKTIGAVSNSDSAEIEETSPAGPLSSSTSEEKSTDLTIPLLLPTNFTRPLASGSDATTSTIPLNLPSSDKKKNSHESGVLSSLSEADLIRKAQEMLGETELGPPPPSHHHKTSSDGNKGVSFSIQAKRPKLDVLQPPVPGLNDD